MNKIFSIIIPVYNGAGVVERALDSIYSQDLSFDEFEIICVDDCSPTLDTYDALYRYKYNGEHPSNLIVERHLENQRQGGARNSGLKLATGNWILYLDHDDVYDGGSLLELRKAIGLYEQCDIIMFDYKQTEKGRLKNTSVYSKSGFYTEIMCGTDFIQKFPVPYGPVFYLFKREFLISTGLRFVEGVRFEDADYVIHATMLARNITFVPIVVYHYLITQNTTSSIGTDIVKQSEQMFLCSRIGDIVNEFWHKHTPAAKAVLRHYDFLYKDLLKRTLWRLSFNDICRLLEKYPLCKHSEDRIIKITDTYPWMYAVVAQIVRPFMFCILSLKKRQV